MLAVLCCLSLMFLSSSSTSTTTLRRKEIYQSFVTPQHHEFHVRVTADTDRKVTNPVPSIAVYGSWNFLAFMPDEKYHQILLVEGTNNYFTCTGFVKFKLQLMMDVQTVRLYKRKNRRTKWGSRDDGPFFHLVWRFVFYVVAHTSLTTMMANNRRAIGPSRANQKRQRTSSCEGFLEVIPSGFRNRSTKFRSLAVS